MPQISPMSWILIVLMLMLTFLTISSILPPLQSSKNSVTLHNLKNFQPKW